MRSNDRPPLDVERVSIGDAARILGVDPMTLRRNREGHYPQPARVGSRRDRRYDLAELRAYLERDR